MGFFDAIKKYAFPSRSEKPAADAAVADAIAAEVASIDPYSMFAKKGEAIYLYNPDEIVTRKGLTIFDKMRRDDQIRPAMNLKKSIILGSGWSVQSPPGQPPGWEVTEAVRECLYGVEGTFDQAISNILTMLDYGYSISELVWQQGESAVTLKKIKTISPHQITFMRDKFGNLTDIDQNGTKLDPAKFVVSVNESEFGNWYGNSDLSAAYDAWWAKQNATKWLAMLLERHGIPPIFALYDPSVYGKATGLLADLRSILKGMQAATAATIPRPTKDSLEMWTPELATNVQQAFIPALEMYDAKIARALLVPAELGIGGNESSGSRAKAEVHFNIFLLSLRRIREQLAELVVNEKIIRRFVDYNFDVDEYPVFVFSEISDDFREETLGLWNTLVSGGIVQAQYEDEEHIRKKLKFPPREKGNDTDKIPAPGGPNKGGGGADASKPTGKQNPVEQSHGGSPLEFSRAKTLPEEKIDFAEIVRSLDAIESGFIADAKKEILVEKAKIIQASRSGTGRAVGDGFGDGFKWGLEKVFERNMVASFYAGAEDALPKKTFKANPGRFVPAGAKWVKQRARDAAGITSDKLQADLLIIVSNAAKNGTALGEVIGQIADLLLPYVGDENLTVGDEVVTPSRLETIVRTNTTTAYNQGRLVSFRDPDVADYMQGVQYSAILDSRTTSVCELLDGRIFRVDDPDLDRLMPPNHFNCRSVIVPVMIDDPVTKGDYITNAQKGEAKDLAGKGFT